MSYVFHPEWRRASLVALLALSFSAGALAERSTGCRSALDTREALRQLRGQFTLDNGMVLRLAPQGCQLMASIGDASVVRLIEQAQGLWRSDDGRIELLYREDRSGLISRVTLRVPPQDLQLSQR